MMLVGLKQNDKGEFYYDVEGKQFVVPEPVQLRHVGKFFPGPGESRAHIERFNPTTERWEVI